MEHFCWMDTFHTPWASGVAHALKNDADKARIVQELQEVFGVAVTQRRFDRYTGGLARHLCRGQHLLALCAVGTPYFLYLTRTSYATGGLCVFVDRRLAPGQFHPRILLTRLAFDDALFNGTLIEGDLVTPCGAKPTRPVFLMGDLLGVEGCSLLRARVRCLDRLQRLQRLQAAQHHADPATDACALAVRPVFQLSQLRVVLELVVPHLNYACRGLAFRSLTDTGVEARDVMFVFPQPQPLQPQPQPLLVTSGVEGLPPNTDQIDQQPQWAESQEGEDEGEGAAQVQVLLEAPAEEAMFFVRRSHLPDVYYLYSTEESAHTGCVDDALVACIPSLSASVWMKAQFSGHASAAHAAIRLKFRFHQGFRKWVPVVYE